jgi:hypothetical protein
LGADIDGGLIGIALVLENITEFMGIVAIKKNVMTNQRKAAGFDFSRCTE